MYIKRHYGFWMTLKWSKKPFILGTLYTLAICWVYYYFNFSLAIPWQPLSVIGIAVAFYLGFKNNSSYDRTWEARKIWGSIVNNSRTFGAAIVSFVQGENAEEIQKEIIYRHIAWLTALRFQLRLSRTWEHTDERIKKYFTATVCESYTHKLDTELAQFISRSEIDEVDQLSNRATQIMMIQSKRLQELKDQGFYEDFRHMELHHLVQSFYEDQGKSERIKNFPFPRQYASTALWLTMVFCVCLPFGMLDVFMGSIGWLFWMSPLISGLIIWIFFLMEKIGDYSENPFEGTYNDVPITNIARTIEIDMREMIKDKNIPKPTEHENGFLL
ncbi:MAG: bestrophin family protein [Bacteroidia bacterium]